MKTNIIYATRISKLDEIQTYLEGLLERESKSDVKFVNPDTRKYLDDAVEALQSALMYEEIARHEQTPCNCGNFGYVRHQDGNAFCPRAQI